MVDTKTFDIYVGETFLVEVHRNDHAIVAQRFARRVNYQPKLVLRPSPRYRRWGWTVPALFALGCLIALWVVLS
jgi:hypothetical protein